MADMKQACAIDTNMTQNGGQQSCTESPEESEKASMQVSALLCNLLQTSQVPPLGLGESVKPSGRMSDSASTDTNMTQFEAVVNSFQALSAEDQLSLIWKLLSLRSTSEAEGELGAIAKVKTTIMQ